MPLILGDPNDIIFVGQQGHNPVDGKASTAVAFALTGGVASVPAAGDFVLIVVGATASTLVSNRDVTPAVSGYTELVTPFETFWDFVRLGFGIYYKIMGGSPDTTFTVAGVDALGGGGATEGEIAIQITVWRGVDPGDVLASTVETIASASGSYLTTLDPPDITVGVDTIDPGTIAGGVPRRTLGASFALQATTGAFRGMAVGAVCQDDIFDPGNFTTAYYQYSTGSRPLSTGTVFGEVLEIEGGGGEEPPPTEDEAIIRVWAYTLDGKSFYVLNLGVIETLVCDVLAEQWYIWGSGASDIWRARTGCEWLGGRKFAEDWSYIITGDNTNGALYFLSPDDDFDDDADVGDATPRTFTRQGTGQVVVSPGYASVPCFGVQLMGSVGKFADDDAAVNLQTSDDQGNTWNDQGNVLLDADEFTARVNWRSLGSMVAPGRLFRITDTGALKRIDNLEMDEGRG